MKPFGPFVVLAAAALVVLVGGNRALSVERTGNRPMQKGSPVIEIPRWDGVSAEGGLRLVALAGDAPTVKPYSRFGAVARIGWNAEGLVADVDVTDSTPAEAPDVDHLYNGDSVELYLKGPDAKTGMLQFVVSPGRDPAHPEVRQKFFDYREKGLRDRVPPTGRAACRKTADGYRVRLLLPWKNLEVTPGEGVTVGARVCVNDGETGKERTRLYWVAPGGVYDFQNPTTVRLSEKAGGDAPQSVAWAAYDEMTTVRVNTVAERGLAGKSVDVREAGEVRASGKLAADGERALGMLSFPAPPVGKRNGPLEITVDGKPIATLTLPDIEAERLALFRRGESTAGRGGSAWVVPRFQYPVFSGETFPAFAYSDPARIRALVGDFTVTQEFYNAAGERVTRAEKPGRYGAVTTVTGQTGAALHLYHTLFRLPPDATAGTANETPAVLAAAFEAKPGETPADPERTDRYWWHNLRKRLGNAVRYEYAVRLPRAYEADPAKRWPVICYLHGSGGGTDEAWPKVKEVEGPTGHALADPDFPFIAVTLRSPGGWFAPAVNDVLDEVAAKYRTDPARYYLTGFSMGGMGTWTVAFDRPDRFAAIVPVAGRDGRPTQAAQLKGMGVWVWNGADDTTTTPADARRAVEALKAAGVEVRYTEIPGAGHVDALNTAYKEPELYTWFLKHHR